MREYFQKRNKLRQEAERSNTTSGDVLNSTNSTIASNPTSVKISPRSKATSRNVSSWNRAEPAALDQKAAKRRKNKIGKARARRENLSRDAWYATQPTHDTGTSTTIETDESHTFRVIKQAVEDVYRSLSGSDNGPMQLKLSPSELANAASAPASTDEERHKAFDIIRIYNVDDAISLLRSAVYKANPGSPRRSRIAEALARLGQPPELLTIHPVNNSIPHGRELHWSVLPPGWWNDPIYRRGITRSSPTDRVVLERLRFVDQLGPLDRFVGHDRFGSDPYWVFVFASYVVAECPLEGNAIYVINGTGDWRNLLYRSKMDLLKTAPDRVLRVMHRGDWKSRLRRILGY